ncbi:MAG: biotin--[acetyl-CoA-carboxylase] ligase, partial [Anaerolineales bacterium]|nr:biotin--[acetyl-CoA-carboxylase] ligase [Anaerolineales bacterium]
AASLLLPLPAGFDPAAIARLSGLGALAVCEALEAMGLAPEIKWPNDVLLGGKKTCGVLAEAHWMGGALTALILGIGINLAASSVPPAEALNFPATCVEAELGRAVDPGGLLRAVLKSALAWQPRLAGEELLQAWEGRLAYRGRRVHLQAGGEAVAAELLGLAADGSLRLRLDGGEERAFQAGEIRILPGV